MKPKLTHYLALFLVLFAQITFAQERSVSGTVSDNNGLPLPGVSVLVKGSKEGTQTDFDGKFKIQASATQVLVFSYIGMRTKEVVAKSTSLNVKMEDNATELEGVVVNVLGVEVKKNQLASAYSKVRGNAITDSGETSLLKGLSGKASSVSIVSNSGDPGSGAYVQIRGQNTITGDIQPLYVVDGIPTSNDELGSGVDGVGQQSRLNDINPNDIESVQILKGASAGALWGSRAKNGVIIITTKKGKKGRLSFEVNTSVSFDKANVYMDLQDRFGQGSGGNWKRNDPSSFGDKISTRSGLSDTFNTTGAYFISNSGNTYYPINSKNSQANFNRSNYDAVIGQGKTIDNHISVSGGTENSNFYLGVGNTKQDGIIRNSNYDRSSIDFSMETKVLEKTTFKGKFSYSNVKSNRIQQGSNTSGLLLGLYRSPADFDNSDYIGTHYEANGAQTLNSQRSYRRDVGTYGLTTSGYNNPLWTTDKQLNPNVVDRFTGGFELKHEVKTWLSLLVRTGFDGYSDKRISLFPINSRENTNLGSASENVTDFMQYNVDMMALGNLKLNSDVGLDYLLGYNYGEDKYDQRGGTYKNFLIDTDLFSYDNAILADKTVFMDRTYQKNSGAYFTTAFDYKNYLFLTLGGRLETSSTYSPNLKSYFYPSAELGYRFTENLKSNIISDGKLRLTYGKVASNPGPYKGSTYLDSANSSNYLGYSGGYDSGAYSGSFQHSTNGGNINLRPEVKTEIEFGLDFKLFQRLKLSTTYYTNETKDLLIDKALAGSSTFTSIYGNFATIQNRGLELEFDANILSKDSKIKWSIYGSWSKNKNEVTALEGSKFIALAGFTGTQSGAMLGEPLGVLYGGKFARDANGTLILDANGFPTAATDSGVIGDPNPKWRGGIGTVVEYKNFKLSTLFDASIGGQLWDGTNGALTNFGRTWETANEVTLTTPTVNYAGTMVPAGTVRGNLQDFGAGPVLLDQSWYTDMGSGFGPVAEQFVKSASWVKWRELKLSYLLKIKDKYLGIESATFSCTGRNLWLWTEAKDLGQDPETNLTGASSGRGLQYFNSPNTKSFIFTVNLKF
jgi:TonB-linked SusC/RagA family outer membrane protein